MKANHENIKHSLSIVRGQIEGIINMIDNDAYCLDVSNQVLASIALLEKVNQEIIMSHLSHCVLHAQSEEEKKEKLEEIKKILPRL